MAMKKKKVAKAIRKKAVQRKTVMTNKPKMHAEVHVYKKELGRAPLEKSFVLHDGRKLRTLYELIDELEGMADDTFHAFVNEWKNDFANWTQDVFEAHDLANDLRRIEDKFGTQRAILKHFTRELQKLVPPAEHKKEHKHHTTHKEHNKGAVVRL